jgi:hypothetical protein
MQFKPISDLTYAANSLLFILFRLKLCIVFPDRVGIRIRSGGNIGGDCQDGHEVCFLHSVRVVFMYIFLMKQGWRLSTPAFCFLGGVS